MHIKYFFILICLITFTYFRAQNDGTTVNIRLYPTQTLTINPADADKSSYNESDDQDTKFIMISSPSGFEVRLQHDLYSGKAGFKNTDQAILEKDTIRNLINYKKGVIEKIFEIDSRKNKKRDLSKDQNYYILTMMSN
ncbi:hypothetical protein [Chryseobacterium sp. POE27]|uniref:hypothetical protein n=1 Tax=Chryseobacterium sp. POE27 TaxID=3138177 RepID=UPI003219CDC9